MGYRSYMVMIVVVLLGCSTTAQARLFDKWGFRLGTGQVVGDNISGNIRESDVASRFLGLNGAFELEPEYNLWIELRGELRYAAWRYYDRDYSDSRLYTYEYAQGVSFLYSLPIPTKPKFSLSYRIGIEHNFLHPFSGRAADDYREWKLSSWSWLTGGEVAIPFGVPELVFGIRYDEDLTDNVEPDHHFTPKGSRFSEVHYLVGMNFDLRK